MNVNPHLCSAIE